MRRHHVFGQPRAQLLTHGGDFGVGLRVVGVTGDSVGRVGRQIQIGQRPGPLSVGGSDEHRVHGARLGSPGDRDAVSGVLANAVELFGDNGIRALGQGQRVGQGEPVGEGVFDVDVADHSRAGDLGDANRVGSLGHQPVVQPAQARALGPRPAVCGGQ